MSALTDFAFDMIEQRYRLRKLTSSALIAQELSIAFKAGNYEALGVIVQLETQGKIQFEVHHILDHGWRPILH